MRRCSGRYMYRPAGPYMYGPVRGRTCTVPPSGAYALLATRPVAPQRWPTRREP